MQAHELPQKMIFENEGKLTVKSFAHHYDLLDALDLQWGESASGDPRGRPVGSCLALVRFDRILICSVGLEGWLFPWPWLPSMELRLKQTRHALRPHTPPPALVGAVATDARVVATHHDNY